MVVFFISLTNLCEDKISRKRKNLTSLRLEPCDQEIQISIKYLCYFLYLIFIYVFSLPVFYWQFHFILEE